mmetsp:Transcript_17727/g.26388  ORF Transcript_17727/g.26388 Transcript_17727/m.26388 type:complete len:205 (-) Transcript_17727:122-736(-)
MCVRTHQTPPNVSLPPLMVHLLSLILFDARCFIVAHSTANVLLLVQHRDQYWPWPVPMVLFDSLTSTPSSSSIPCLSTNHQMSSPLPLLINIWCKSMLIGPCSSGSAMIPTHTIFSPGLMPMLHLSLILWCPTRLSTHVHSMAPFLHLIHFTHSVSANFLRLPQPLLHQMSAIHQCCALSTITKMIWSLHQLVCLQHTLMASNH